ncbi:MAG: PP0621 family protein [Pseudomonadota bacterium]
MARVLLLILLGWLLYVVIKRIITTSKFKNTASESDAAKPKVDERIVQCSQCGLHVPESDSHIQNNQVVCNNSECNHTSN